MKKRLISLILALALSSAFALTASANNTKLVALTFDDGPNWKHTPGLLDALSERGVRASFFLVGYTLEVNMDIAQRAHEDGHQLCNHSYDHPWFSKISKTALEQQLGSVNSLLEEISGDSKFMVRVPYGDITPTVQNRIAAPLIQWSVDPTNGSVSATETQMYNTMLKTVKDGSIILLHDTDDKNVSVAIRSIDALLEQGYEFVTLNELFRLRGVEPVDGQVYFSVPQGPEETAYDESRLEEHWGYGAIRAVTEAGIMEGDGDGFKPNGYMSRAMAATVLMRLAEATDKLSWEHVFPLPSHGSMGLPEGAWHAKGLSWACVFLGRAVGISAIAQTASLASSLYHKLGLLPDAPRFTDVPEDAWYAEAVNWACLHSYVQGVSEGIFDPESYITKEQFYTLLARFASEELRAAGGCASPAKYRDDVKISEWADESVTLFREAGFSSLNDPEIFRPGDYMTRAEAAELSAFLLELIK